MHHQFLLVDRKRIFLVMILNHQQKKQPRWEFDHPQIIGIYIDCTIIVKTWESSPFRSISQMGPSLPKWRKIIRYSKVYGLLIRWSSSNKNGAETLGQKPNFRLHLQPLLHRARRTALGQVYPRSIPVDHSESSGSGKVQSSNGLQ